MPRHRHKGKRKRNAQSNNEGNVERTDKRQRQGEYTLTIKENELMLKYYKEQGIIKPAEWDDFVGKLKEPLPVSFRVSRHRGQATDLLNVIQEEYFRLLTDVEVDGEKLHPPQCLPWYPGGLAWQINTTKKAVGSHEAFNRLHNFLVAETESGNVSRQETVSMIPPIVMAIEPHHKVLDMCASPGSKTAQLIEYLHKGDGSVPDGIVIANDSDNKRCYLMVHQVKRLQSPCFLVINHDACTFPKIILPSEKAGMEEFMLFDRVLADVPCSGDGTIRKNVDVWTKWLPVHAYNLMGLQLRIVKRGLELLKVGGRLVYSTCSMNPVEDEAVICNILKDNQGAVRLVDVSAELPGLIYTKGRTTWTLMSRDGDMYSCMDEVPAELSKLIRPNMFPPSPELAAELNLDRCIRVLPHQQNTGAFFVAVLEKFAPLPGAATAEPFPAGTLSERGAKDTLLSSKKQQRRIRGYKEDPFLFLSEDDPIWPGIKEFYGIPDSFPLNQLIYRSHDGKRSLYFSSEVVHHIINLNEHRIKIKRRCGKFTTGMTGSVIEPVIPMVINTGVKVFGKCPSPHVPNCNFRVIHEGLPCVHSSLLDRQVTLSRQDILRFVTTRNPYFDTFSEETQKQLKSMKPGSAVFSFTPADSDALPCCKIIMAGWCGKMSCRAFVNKHDRFHLLSICGVTLEDIHKILKSVQDLPVKPGTAEDAAIPEGGDSAAAASTSRTDDDDDKTELATIKHDGDKDMLDNETKSINGNTENTGLGCNETKPVHGKIDSVRDVVIVQAAKTIEAATKTESAEIDRDDVIEQNGNTKNIKVESKDSL